MSFINYLLKKKKDTCPDHKNDIQFSAVTQSCPTPCAVMESSTPGLPVHHKLPEPTQTHVHWVGDVIQPSHPLSSPSLPAFILPSIRVFPMSQFFASGGQSVGASASASVLPMNNQDWLELTSLISLQFKGLFKSFLQHHSSKASILQRSVSFMVWLSQPYMTAGKTIALTR